MNSSTQTQNEAAAPTTDLNQLDLPKICLKRVRAMAASQYSFSNQRLEQLLREYLQFLFLCKSYPEQKICPTPDVDKIWHLHMLDSANYHTDCANYFDYYLHHDPCIGAIDEDSIKGTIRLYAEVFGPSAALRYKDELLTCANPGGGCGSISRQ